MTRVRVITGGGGGDGEGTVFVARSGVGRVAFDDTMEVVVWRPARDNRGGFCRLVKLGRVVVGWAEIEVRPRAEGGSLVAWREELGVRGVPRVFDPLVGWVARRMFGRAVDRLLRRP